MDVDVGNIAGINTCVFSVACEGGQCSTTAEIAENITVRIDIRTIMICHGECCVFREIQTESAIFNRDEIIRELTAVFKDTFTVYRECNISIKFERS